jgi:hypothetical protein
MTSARAGEVDTMSHSYSQMQRQDSDVPLVWLSHILPYCTSIKNNYAPELASLCTYVIDTLLSSAPLDHIVPSLPAKY